MEDRKNKRYMTAVYRYAFSRLVLHYGLYYEYIKSRLAVSEEEEYVEKEFYRLLTRFFMSDNTVEDLDRLRRQIIDRTEVLTAYLDCFQIYEYVLNRIERRFVKMKEPVYTPEEIAGKVVNVLEGMEQAAERNRLLRTIISHLPVRLTRQKFYSMVTERFTAYTGLNRESVENLLYMLKAAAMVSLPDNMEQEKELHQILEYLKSTDYRTLDKDGFDRCREMASTASATLTDKTEFCVMIQEMVNELYILVLTEDKKLVEAGEESVFRTGLQRLQTAVKAVKDISEEEMKEILAGMEGVQESVEDVVMSGNSGTDQVLRKLDKLASGSIFMSLEEKEAQDETVDRDWIEHQAATFCQELDGLFVGLPKPVTRSVMAKVLSSLPLMFQNSAEVHEYVRASLESCTDLSERETCLELLEQELMDIDDVV